MWCIKISPFEPPQGVIVSFLSPFVWPNFFDGAGGICSLLAMPHRLEHLTTFKIQNSRQEAPKWPMVSGKRPNPMFKKGFKIRRGIKMFTVPSNYKEKYYLLH